VAAAPELEPVYLLTGSDRPKVETAVERLRRHFTDEATELVSAQEVSGAEAAALCNAGSLFGDMRLVLVAAVDRWKAADVKAIEAYLASPAPATVLALVGDEVKKESPLAKACAKVGAVLAYDVAKKKLDAWVAERFRQADVRAEPEAVAALVQLVGDDLHQLASEIEKLALWAGDEPIGEREGELLVAAAAETPPFALTDAWGARGTGRALAATQANF
jgi:DNA polymerase-3 subunit delta